MPPSHQHGAGATPRLFPARDGSSDIRHLQRCSSRDRHPRRLHYSPSEKSQRSRLLSVDSRCSDSADLGIVAPTTTRSRDRCDAAGVVNEIGQGRNYTAGWLTRIQADRWRPCVAAGMIGLIGLSAQMEGGVGVIRTWGGRHNVQVVVVTSRSRQRNAKEEPPLRWNQ
jgi:hypothetical protein